MPAIRQDTVEFYSSYPDIQGFQLISREINIHIQGNCPWGLISMQFAVASVGSSVKVGLFSEGVGGTQESNGVYNPIKNF